MKLELKGEFIDEKDAVSVLHAIANLIAIDLTAGGFRANGENHIEWKLVP